MWSPDIRTIFLVIFLINAFLALMLFFCYRSQKTYGGFAIWASSLLLQSLAYLLFFLRGEIPVLLSILVANTLTILSIMMRIDAIRRFFCLRPFPAGHYLLLLPVFGSFAYFTYIADSMVLRAAISTLFIVPVLIVAAIVPLRIHDSDTRIIRYLFSVSLALPGMVLALRILAWLIVPAEYTLFSTDLFNTAFFIAAIIGDILATGCFLMLNMLRSHKELTQANEKLGLLSSITRHDISNQLVALAGFLDLSKQCGDREGHGQELVGKEMKIVNTITHQIQFTGDYERMGVMEPEWQNVGATVRKAAAALPVQNISILVERQDLQVLADPLFFKVFYNLIDNSLRYGGAGMRNIVVTSRETPDGLLLVYEDDGIGIADMDRKRLFDRGFGKHTGLGLFLSREVLAITGITIVERGEPGNGARFEMLVPNGAYRFSTA
jgi:signal transduction histidine kinase